MPIYEYECPSCCNVFEVFQRMTEAPLTSCPECSGPVKKLVSVSSFQLKGGGWYADGYSSNSSSGSGSKPASSTGSSPAKSEKGSKAGSNDSSPPAKSKTASSASSS